MKKKYCKNCKWFKNHIIGYRCQIKVREDSYSTDYIINSFHPNQQNEKGNCKNYKKLWWKFWV